MNATSESLRITEIFYSLQGESIKVGLPTVFIRLTGCPLRCQYCDTAYAFSGGEIWTFSRIMDAVKQFGGQHICVTGGEPLAQPKCAALMKALCDAGYWVSIETSGSRDISVIDPRVSIVMDIKTPDSKESNTNRWENIALLKASDEIKFVLCSESDYHWAKDIVKKERLDTRCSILFSPSWNELKPRELADWVLKDKLNVRFQMQLHKILWDDAPGH